MNKKEFVNTILVVISVILVGLSGYADETTNWKTYQNEKYGFEMKYPVDWNYREGSSAVLLAVFSFKTSGARQAYLSFVSVPPPEAFVSLEEMKNKHPERLSRSIVLGNETWLEQVESGCETKDQCAAQLFYFNEKFMKEGVALVVGIELSREELDHDLLQRLDKDLVVLQQALATFKFIR